MLSNSSKYAIKAVLYLALNSNEKVKINAKNLSEPINVPQAYISKLLQDLVREGVISSVRGVKGGFYLTEENLSNPIMNIIKVIDGEEKLTSCMLSLERCDNDNPCPLHSILNQSRNAILDSLNNKTIADLMLSVKSGETLLPL